MKENRKFESIENNKVPKYSFKLNNKKKKLYIKPNEV